MTMSNRSRTCSCNVLNPSCGEQWTTGSTSRTRGTSLLLLLLIAVSVTAADRYDQPPALALMRADADDAAGSGSSLLSLKGAGGWISNDVSKPLRTSSILPASSSANIGVQSHNNIIPSVTTKHRFSKPIAATGVHIGKVAKGSKKQQQTAAEAVEELSSQQVPELQVGCADGFIRAEDHHRRKDIQKKWEKKTRSRRAANPVEGERKRRGYYQWTSKTVVQAPPHTPSQTAYSVWQPSLQQIARPYFIPMWGSAGRNPVYFPPQPLNPPFPLDNPRTSYLPSMPYLPPYPPRREDTNNDEMSSTTTLGPMWMDEDDMDNGAEEGDGEMIKEEDIVEGGNRFDRPVWGSSDETDTNSRPNVMPTRRPKISGITTEVPSILHGSSSVNQNSNQNGFNNNMPQTSNSFGSPMRPNQIGANNNHPIMQQPQFTRPPPPRTTTTTTTRRPTTSNNNNNNVASRPSRCVWAIVSCCTASSGQINFACFEELGCQGAFWDKNPCDSDVARAAIANALKFYG